MQFDFEWDEAKAVLNERKHGMNFRQAILVFNDVQRLERIDLRDDYGEVRWEVIGMVMPRLLFVVYTARAAKRRIISARKATKNEEDSYKKQNGKLQTRYNEARRFESENEGASGRNKRPRH